MRDPNHVTTHAEALAHHAAQVEADARIDANNAEFDARQAKIAEILSEIAEGSMVDAVSVHDLALAREVIAAGKGAVTWSSVGKSWARLCKAKPGSIYPPL